MPGFNIFCDPTPGSSLRSDGSPNDYGVITGNCASILGGCLLSATPNCNNDCLSAILMGDNNNLNVFSPAANAGMYNTIANGSGNFVGGTVTGSLAACYSSIFGGNNNCIDTDPFTNGCYNTIVNGSQNIVSGCYNNIFGGSLNNVAGIGYASILGGSCNVTQGQYSVIGAGYCNNIAAAAQSSGILTGSENCICAQSNFSSITSGCENTINTEGWLNFIGSGHQNQFVNGNIYASAIVAGCNNCIAYPITGSIPVCNIFIGAGKDNFAFGQSSFIGAGDTNQICSLVTPGLVSCSSIVGGCSNTITDNGTATADMSFIGGGNTNNIFGVVSSIVGGQSHNICSQYSFVGGGDTNFIGLGSDCSFIGGGNVNCVGSVGGSGTTFGFIGGGVANCIDDTGATNANGVIGGGNGNTICAGSVFSGIFGGTGNFVRGNGLFAGGGAGNSIYSAATAGVKNSVIGGGQNNTISTDLSFIGGGNTNNIFIGGSSIVGGQNHNISSLYSFIGGGDTNTINVLSDCSFIGGGWMNSIGVASNSAGGSIFSVIAGGGNNCIDDSTAVTTYGVIGGGQGNYICAGSNWTGIFGGNNNCLCGNNAFIGGGYINCIVSGLGPVIWAAIGGGQKNVISDNGIVTADASFIGGGSGNKIYGQISTISGGDENSIYAAQSFIGGGLQNSINKNSNFSFINDGFRNSIGATSGLGLGADYSGINGGCCNHIDDIGTATSYGVIGGGQGNTIEAGTNHSSIFSGNGNTVADSCSSILGGVGNTIPVGFPNAFIVGSNIVLGALAGNPNSLHVNNLWMNPATYASWPGVAPGGTFTPGTVYVDTSAGKLLRVQ